MAYVPWKSTAIKKTAGSFVDHDKPLLLKKMWFANQRVKNSRWTTKGMKATKIILGERLISIWEKAELLGSHV